MNSRPFYYPAITAILLFTFLGCSSSKGTLTYQIKSAQGDNHIVNDDIEPDEDMAYFIEPYAGPIRARMNRVLTVSEGTFTVNQPEGSLGNLVADITRSRATYLTRARVDIAVLSNNRLRSPLSEGEITVSDVFDVMPFDYSITVMKFSGRQILNIADEIAAAGGEPISGMRLRIQDGKASDVLIGYRSIDPEQEYLLATSNWAAEGGGDISTLWEPLDRTDHELLIRDALVDYLNNRSTIQPQIDYRLR